MCLENRVLLYLMKLRHNIGFVDLGYRFSVSDRAGSSIFYALFYKLHCVCPADQRSRSVFGEVREELAGLPLQKIRTLASSLTALKLHCAASKRMDEKRIYTFYKSQYTMKVLVGIAPNETIILSVICLEVAHLTNKLWREAAFVSFSSLERVQLPIKASRYKILCQKVSI